MNHKEWLHAIFQEVNNRDPALLAEVIMVVNAREGIE